MKQNLKPYLQSVVMKDPKEKSSCISEDIYLDYKEFAKYAKPFKHIRVGVGGGKRPFGMVFFKVPKSDILKTVKNFQYGVTFSVMKNPMIEGDIGTMYISEMIMMMNLEEKK